MSKHTCAVQCRWYIPVIWGAVAAACLSYMHLHRTHSIVTTGFLLLCGVLGWQLTEYCIHRFLFHIEPSSYWGITLHFTFHGCHHKWPMDSLRLVFPPVPAVPIVSGVFYAMHQLLPKVKLLHTVLLHALHATDRKEHDDQSYYLVCQLTAWQHTWIANVN